MQKQNKHNNQSKESLIIRHSSKIDTLQCKSNVLMLCSPTKQRYIHMSTTNVQYVNFWTQLPHSVFQEPIITPLQNNQ